MRFGMDGGVEGWYDTVSRLSAHSHTMQWHAAHPQRPPPPQEIRTIETNGLSMWWACSSEMTEARSMPLLLDAMVGLGYAVGR